MRKLIFSKNVTEVDEGGDVNVPPKRGINHNFFFKIENFQLHSSSRLEPSDSGSAMPIRSSSLRMRLAWSLTNACHTVQEKFISLIKEKFFKKKIQIHEIGDMSQQVPPGGLNVHDIA